MAKLNAMHHTCSMSELGIAGSIDPMAYSAASLKKVLIQPPKRGAWGEMVGVAARQKKAIICNTIHYVAVLTKLGFKEVEAYNGNDGAVVHVMLYIQPTARLRKGQKS